MANTKTQFTKFPTVYVKCVGRPDRWYVGENPLRMDAGPCEQLNGYIYGPTDQAHAEQYARCVGEKVVVQDGSKGHPANA